MPDRFEPVRDPTGFRLLVPEGWDRTQSGPRIYFRDPASSRYLLVDQTTEPEDDAYEDWQDAAEAREGESGYRLLRLERVQYKGWQSADWEFVRQEDGEQVHVLNRNVRVSDSRAYALLWSTPADEWAGSRGTFDAIANSFQPAG